ncbi:MAG TPA: fibrillarin-like rRNA/tRNA 2'-O-methyltransferase [Thermoplasmata archaeon]|nr:fibrillarin-like rRNA/tRNA 2'-O-methyltransferase [Thermoplasmata archaeon]HUJ77476.1 fibrillarin-like rRNA/tRNA 2'-O-methyltransferase [Thermoplasmata archaeon]
MQPSGWKEVYRRGRDLYTRNLTPGRRVYGEDVHTEDGVEYRRWDPFRSKLAAYLLRARPHALFEDVGTVLYLGGGHGTTVSHLSDILPDARIVVVEKSPLAFAPLLALAQDRPNLRPILADAQLPERYAADVGRAELLYQDVAQRTQASIFVENSRACLAARGRGLLMLKVRSVTQARPAAAVLDEARRILTAAGHVVRGTVDLAPLSREHLAMRLDA